jgi:hypothetical protein
MRWACSDTSLSSTRSHISLSSAAQVAYEHQYSASKETGPPASRVRAIRAVQNGTGETENKCEKCFSLASEPLYTKHVMLIHPDDRNRR